MAARPRSSSKVQMPAYIQPVVSNYGVNREQATSYHRLVLDFYIQFLILANRIGEEIPEHSVRRIEAMIDYVASLAGSSGNAPMIGDSDDARGIPLMELIGWDFRDDR